MSDPKRTRRGPGDDDAAKEHESAQVDRHLDDDEPTAEELDTKLDVGIDDSFPASDPPAIVSPARPPRHESDD